MIEAIARAMHASRPQTHSWDEERSSVKDRYLADAEAALTAMETPTFDMKMAGAEAITAQTMKAMANYDAAIDCWRAMIHKAKG